MKRWWLFIREQVVKVQERAEAKEAVLKATGDELQDTTDRLQEHQEAARSLMSPKQFDDQMEAARKAEREKAEVKSRE